MCILLQVEARKDASGGRAGRKKENKKVKPQHQSHHNLRNSVREWILPARALSNKTELPVR